MTSVAFRKYGETRKGVRVLSPGTYDLCRDQRYVLLRRRCSIETTETYRGFEGWVVTGYQVDTLHVLPSRWRLLVAWLLRRDPPMPRAIVVTEGK